MLPRKFIDIKTSKVFDLIKPYIKGKVLDVGAGNCLLSEFIANELKVKVQPLDIVNKNLTKMKLKLYDGKHIPFKDKSFNTSLLIFVLHYVHDKENFLKEVKRVTKKKLIVLEDTPKNIVEYLFKKVWVILETKSFKFLYYETADEIEKLLRTLKPRKIESRQVKLLWNKFLNRSTHSFYVLYF